VAPGPRRRVELGDPLRDVLSGAQRRIRQASERLIHPDDVRSGGERLALTDEVAVQRLHLDAVVEQPLHHPVGLGVAPLPATFERDHERGRVRDHPFVLVLGEAELRDERVVAAIRSRRARHASTEDLELVVEDVGAVADPELRRRVEPDVLGALGSQPGGRGGCIRGSPARCFEPIPAPFAPARRGNLRFPAAEEGAGRRENVPASAGSSRRLTPRVCVPTVTGRATPSLESLLRVGARTLRTEQCAKSQCVSPSREGRDFVVSGTRRSYTASQEADPGVLPGEAGFPE
jgi:hypothetical protein